MLAMSREPETIWPWLARLLAGVAEWGAYSVFLAGARRLPLSERLVWLCVAVAAAFQAFGVSLEHVAQLLQSTPDPLTQTITALVAAAISVISISQSASNALPWASRSAQGLLDIVLIGASAFLISTAHPFQVVTVARITARDLSTVMTDSLLLIALSWVVLSNPRFVRLTRGYLALSFICHLSGLAMLGIAEYGRWRAITPVIVEPFDTLHWGILALGTSMYHREPLIAHDPSATPRQRLSDVTTPLPWISAMVVLATSTLVGRSLKEPLMVLAVTSGIREIVTFINRRIQRERIEQAVVNERRELVYVQQATQQQIDGLARLIHDQAAPINGLWYLQGELARASAPHLSSRFAEHLEHLQTLADHLRAVLKAQPRPAVLRRCRVDVLPIISAAIDSARERAGLGAVQVMPSIAARDTLVLGDQTAVRRILDNLLTNALDATPRQGIVVIEVWDDRAYPNFLTITVRDSGHGLSAEEQARIFEPGSVVRGPGLGLGLSIVRDLTTQMDGACGVSSNPGVGSAFWVRLPCLDAATHTRSPTPPGHTE